jgi:hypothetical protein
MRAQKDYRELDLDRSRALYELEVKTNLGTAMVEYTGAEREMVMTDFRIVLAWEQLDSLTGLATYDDVSIELPQAQPDNTTSNRQ